MMNPSKTLNSIVHNSGAPEYLNFQIWEGMDEERSCIVITVEHPFMLISRTPSIDVLAEYMPYLEDLSNDEVDFLIQLSDETVEKGEFWKILDAIQNQDTLPQLDPQSALDFIESHPGERSYHIQYEDNTLSVDEEDVITDTDPVTMYQALLANFLAVLKVDQKLSSNSFTASLNLKAEGMLVEAKRKDIFRYIKEAFSALERQDETLCTMVYMAYHEPDRTLASQITNSIYPHSGCRE